MTNQPKYNAKLAAEDTWQAMLAAGVFVEGNFTFASGQKATLKADAEKLYQHPKELAVVLGHFATHPSVQAADVLLYVPDGMKQFMTSLGREIAKPVVNAMRTPNATSKYDFMFSTPQDSELAQSAQRPLIGEDVVTTLGSIAAMRQLLRPEQHVESLAILLRGTVNPDYQTGLVEHYLVQRQIPTDAAEFNRILAEE